VKDKKVDVECIVSHPVPLRRRKAFAMAVKREGLKVVVEPWGCLVLTGIQAPNRQRFRSTDRSQSLPIGHGSMTTPMAVGRDTAGGHRIFRHTQVRITTR
jgi:hypothetical protein